MVLWFLHWNPSPNRWLELPTQASLWFLSYHSCWWALSIPVRSPASCSAGMIAGEADCIIHSPEKIFFRLSRIHRDCIKKKKQKLQSYELFNLSFYSFKRDRVTENRENLNRKWVFSQFRSSVFYRTCLWASVFHFSFLLLFWDESSIFFSSATQSCLTLCDPMDHSTPGFSVHHQLPELVQTHVHRVGDAIQPSHPLLSLSSPAFSLSQHQDLFQGVSSSHQVAKVLEFQLQHQSFQWIVKTDFL